MATTLSDLAAEDFVSLTTFRRTGVPVSSAVWVVADGDDLLVWTQGDSGKVKRLRNNPVVQLRPCNRRGAVRPDAPTVDAQAAVVADGPTVERTERLLRTKYRLEYRVITTVERLVRRRPGAGRVVLRISAVPTGEKRSAG